MTIKSKKTYLEERVAPNVYDAEAIPDSVRAEIEHLLRSGDLFRYNADKDSYVSLLEKEFAEFIGADYALAVSSCSSAMFLALKTLDLPQGSRVLIPAFTFAAVPSAVVHANCIPVLVEVNEDYRVDIDDFAAKLHFADAVLISHMRGHTSDMDAIMRLCAANRTPVIEDAAHSLGTKWRGRNIGTIGRVGCFSFQSYKLVNAGEGGMLVTNDPDLAARAVIMSGAYEQNWKKHLGLRDNFHHLQNQLPLYNMRMQNLSAVIVRAQLAEIPRRVKQGRENHDYVASLLNQSPFLSVPKGFTQEERAPDSIQFNLVGEWSDDQAKSFQKAAKKYGVDIQVFGLSKDNARVFWNWRFLPDLQELPKTHHMLMRACDMRLPARLVVEDLDFIANAVLDAVEEVMVKVL